MANVPQDLRYTKEHEYLKPAGEDGVYFVGITDYAQGELGDVVFVELPSPGASFDAMATFGTIEAVKAVSDLFCPVAGEVVDANGALDANPASSQSDVDALLDAAAYEKLIG
jgi:glycine cleavage system H protein